MLHPKFRGNRSTGSEEEDFGMVFTIHVYEHGSHLGHVPSIMLIDFYFRLSKTFIQSLIDKLLNGF